MSKLNVLHIFIPIFKVCKRIHNILLAQFRRNRFNMIQLVSFILNHICTYNYGGLYVCIKNFIMALTSLNQAPTRCFI